MCIQFEFYFVFNLLNCLPKIGCSILLYMDDNNNNIQYTYYIINMEI